MSRSWKFLEIAVFQIWQIFITLWWYWVKELRNVAYLQLLLP